MRLTRTEAQRKLLHMAAGLFALLLRFMTWRQAALMAIAAFFFNWQALPRTDSGEHYCPNCCTLWTADGAIKNVPTQPLTRR